MKIDWEKVGDAVAYIVGALGVLGFVAILFGIAAVLFHAAGVW